MERLMTLGEYAKHTGAKRDTVYKQYARLKKGGKKLPGVVKELQTEGGITVLTIDDTKLITAAVSGV